MTVSAENAGKATPQSARLFRGLRSLGMPFDALIIFAALLISVHIEWHSPIRETLWFWREHAVSNIPAWKPVTAFCGFAVVLLWISSHHYEFALRKRTLIQEQKLNLQDCLVSGLFLIGALYLVGAETVSRGFVLLFLVLVAFGLGLRRIIYRTFPAEPAGPCNVLIIGADSTARALREQLRDDRGFGYAFKGFVKLSASEPDGVADPNEVIGTIDKLPEHVYRYSVNGLLLTASCGREMTRRIVHQARELGVEARMVPRHIRFGAQKRNRTRVRP